MIKTSPIIPLLLLVLTLFPGCSSGPNNKSEEPTTIIDLYGQLQVNGNRIIDQNGNPVALHGMSFFWSQWIDKYYNQACVKWLVDDWQCTVLRAALGVEPDGYLENPAAEIEKIKTVVDACIDLGIYVIIDWHDHNAHLHTDEAKSFFGQIASLYGDKPNVIYEIYNEPEQISWSDDIKPYAEAVIGEIRNHDPDNLIIVGTPTWSQDVDIATADPIEDANLAYSLHFYAGTHKQYLRDKAVTALARNKAIFVSEFGVCLHTGDGDVDYESAQEWLTFMDNYQLSWCKWSVADKDEGDAVLKEGASQNGGWSEDDLSESGIFIKQEIKTRNSPVFDNLK